MTLSRSFTCAVVLTVPLALVAVAGTAVAQTTATAKYKAEADKDLSPAFTKIRTAAPVLQKATTGKAEFRSAVVRMLAADLARKAGNAALAKSLAGEATSETDRALKNAALAPGATPLGAPAVATSADRDKFISQAESAVVAAENLLATTSKWELAGFEPMTVTPTK